MSTSIDEAVLIELARRNQDQVRETTEDLRRVFSEADTESYHALENIFYSSQVLWYSKEHKKSMAEAFKSSLYSDTCKQYFAAANMIAELTLLVADKFLTEKIILSHLGGTRYKLLDLSYFAVLMSSTHLSEHIVSAAIQKINDRFRMDDTLKIIPDTMITPKVIKTWIVRAAWDPYPANRSAALRIKQIHPEYEEFPDEWVLKVFCGAGA